jgi:hypothetical protein
MTYQPDETAEIPDAVIETKLVEDVAPSVLAKRKLEEEQKKRVEEEQRIQ